MNLNITRATTADAAPVLALRHEAEQWLAEHSIRQWTPDYADDVYPRWVQALERGVCWLITSPETGQPIAHVALDPQPDPDFWGPDDDPHSGLYLGKMIVARTWAGQGVGDAILNWASQQAAQARRSWLRLECRRDNTKLQQYYLDRGFHHVRTAKPTGRRTESGALFQRPAGSQHTPPNGRPHRSLHPPPAA